MRNNNFQFITEKSQADLENEHRTNTNGRMKETDREKKKKRPIVVFISRSDENWSALQWAERVCCVSIFAQQNGC